MTASCMHASYTLRTQIMKKYKFERFNLRANTTVNLRDNLSVDVDLNMIRSSQRQPSVADSGGQSPLYQLYGIPPTIVGRYLIEGTLRADGSSRFGKGHKYGYFPSIGLGWNMTEENFMKGIDWLNNLKVRASYGQLGNENIGLYMYQTLIDSGNGNETTFGNPHITWEKVNMFDVGADISLFNVFAIINLQNISISANRFQAIYFPSRTTMQIYNEEQPFP
ncbi:MAG: TonB-dependent receptor [Phocaeicola sp.]|nr:TonB-dependent receptor [Phocaeicola sp.]